MSTPVKISLTNKSTLFADSGLQLLANALQVQISRDFLTYWGVDAKMYFTPSGANPSIDHWVLGLFDDADVANALGYHDLSPSNLPLGKVFVRTTLADGEKVEVTASHECLEMVGNPDVNLCAEYDDGSGNPSKFYFREACDAVENDEYEIVIPTGWPGAGASVPVSNFILPSWFQSQAAGPFDFLKKLTAPFTLSAGGYVSVLDLGNLSQGWTQITARTDAKALVAARPHRGSRRERLSLPRSQWLRSTYTPGVEAVATEVL